VVLKKAEGAVRWRDTLHHNLGEISQNSFGFSSCFVVTVGMYVGTVVEVFVQDSSNQPLRAPYLDDLQYLCSSYLKPPVPYFEPPCCSP